MTEQTELKNIDGTHDNENNFVTLSYLDNPRGNSISIILGGNYSSTFATGSVPSSRQNIHKEDVDTDLPDEETQVLESLDNLEKGNYEDFSVEDYLKHTDN
jgi:hypothetical protein